MWINKLKDKKIDIKKTISIAVRVTLFFLGLFLLDKGMKFLLISDDSSYTRVMMHELYESEENIDVLFLGSSHTYRSLNPEITDGLFDAYTFNAGSSLQEYDGSYALLVEAAKKNDLKQVYMEVCCSRMNSSYAERTQLTSTYILSDYMKFSLNKVEYLLNASSDTYYLNSFFPALRSREKLLEEDYVTQNVSVKQDEGYGNYQYPGDPEVDNAHYVGRGFVANKRSVKNEGFTRKTSYEPIPDNMISEDERGALVNMIEFCQRKGIEIVFFTAPMADFRASDYGNYDYAIEQLSELCEEYQVDYYDFNLIKPEYFTFESKYYKDENHLNDIGSEIFSNLFANFFTGKISEDSLLYSSYKEKMEYAGERTFGMKYSISKTDNEKIIKLVPVKNGDFPVYVSISKEKTDAADAEVVLEFGTLEDVVVPIDETGKLRINVYNDAQGTTVTNKMTIKY